MMARTGVVLMNTKIVKDGPEATVVSVGPEMIARTGVVLMNTNIVNDDPEATVVCLEMILRTEDTATPRARGDIKINSYCTQLIYILKISGTKGGRTQKAPGSVVDSIKILHLIFKLPF